MLYGAINVDYGPGQNKIKCKRKFHYMIQNVTKHGSINYIQLPMQNVIISRSKNYTINLFRDRNKWKLHTHPYH